MVLVAHHEVLAEVIRHSSLPSIREKGIDINIVARKCDVRALALVRNERSTHHPMPHPNLNPNLNPNTRDHISVEISQRR